MTDRSGHRGDTLSVYEARAADWQRIRGGPSGAEPWLSAFMAETRPAGPVADLGCGPGWFLPHLGPEAIGLDRVPAMLELARTRQRPLVRADLVDLPFRPQSLAAAVVLNAYVHLDRRDTPLALRRLHQACAVNAPVIFGQQGGDDDLMRFDNDDFPGRWFSRWPEQLWRDVLHLCGFAITDLVDESISRARQYLRTVARRLETAPSSLAADLRLLLVGVNPSPTSARTGIGFAHPGNRFWPALLRSGLAVVDRDPDALLARGVGMTDFSKRVTARADELEPAETSDGWARLERVVGWLKPDAVAILGIGPYRLATGNRRAVLGWQTDGIGGRPLYVMPNPSGLNAHTNVDDMAEHFRRAAGGPT